MVTSFHALISRILNIPVGQVERTIGLLGEGTEEEKRKYLILHRRTRQTDSRTEKEDRGFVG